MMTYVCVHDVEAYLREALKAGTEGRCSGVRVGPRLVAEAGREVYAVAARDTGALRCWMIDLNAECQQECAHQVSVPDDRSSCHRYAQNRETLKP